MTAATKHHGNLCNINLSVGPQAYLILECIRLIHKDRTLNALCIAKLVDNSFQIMWCCIIKAHGLFIDHADNTSAIHKLDTFKQRTSQNLILYIGLFIEGLINERRKIKSIRDQICCNPQGFR